MPTQKKTPEASDAALSAIENALDLAGQEARVPNDPDAGEAHSRLPRIDPVDLLKVEPAPEARLEIKPPQRRVKLPETRGPEPAMPPEPRLRAVGTPAAEPNAEARRGGVLPANDDRRVSLQQVMEPLRQRAPLAPYWVAAAFSGLWVLAAWLLLTQNNTPSPAPDAALRSGTEWPLVLALPAIMLPVLFVFALAALHRRSREMRNSARVMAEVAARLAEPEAAGAEAVFTLGQAVRREVASIGDGVERALSRASELESIVHGEVSALERSYADNEYKMRQLVAELAAEREAIMATAERIHNTINVAHQGVSADLGQVGDNIARAIDEAGERIGSLITDKKEELVTTLGRSAIETSDLIRARTGELGATLSSATRETGTILETTASSVLARLDTARAGLLQEIEQVTRGATGGFDEASRQLVERLSVQAELIQRRIEETSQQASASIERSGSALTAEWENATGNVTRQLGEVSEASARLIRETGASLTGEWENTTRAATAQLGEVSEASARLIRETGANLRTEMAETADVVSSALDTNSRVVIELIGTRAIEINDTMREASQEFIAAMEARGGDAARLIEEKGTAVVEALTGRSDELADRMLGTASRIEETLGVTSRTLVSVLGDTSRRIESAMGQGAQEMEALLTDNAQKIANVFGSSGARIEENLEHSLARIEATLASQSRRFQDTLEGTRSGFETAFESQGAALVDLIANRIAHANEAFSLAGESLGQLIADRAREVAAQLRGEMDGYGQALTREATEATERLAYTSRDILKALNEHGQRVNEALVANAVRLAKTVTMRTTDIGDRFEQFEKSITGSAGQIETMLAAQSDALGSRLADRTRQVQANLETLLARIETGVDERAKSIADLVALRTLEFNRVVQERGGTLIGDLDQTVQAFQQRVDTFGARIVEPLGQQIEIFDRKATVANELVGRRLHEAAEQLDARTRNATDTVIVRLDQSADNILVRTGEVERILTALSKEVGGELMNRAEQISTLIDAKGNQFVTSFEQHGLAMVRGLESASAEISQRVTISLAELNTAIESGSGRSLQNLVEANERLRGEVTTLLERLADANQTLNTIVGSTARGLSDIEGRLGERVRGLEATLAAILTAANQGSDALASRVESIRAASGELFSASQKTANVLDERTTAMRTLSSELNTSQAGLAALLTDRQRAFEGLVNTLNARIEDVDAMLRSFSSLVEDQLTGAEARARQVSTLVHQSAESATEALENQYERIRLETGKERERTSAVLRQTYEQANGEMTAMLRDGVQNFIATASDLRQATRDILADLEATRTALATSGLEIPREAREASQNLKRVVEDQLRALSELNQLVSRSGPALDVATPPRPGSETSRFPAQPIYEPGPAPRAAPSRSSAPVPPARPGGGGSWLSGLLERASDEEPATPARKPRAAERAVEAGAARRIETLDSLSVDIARMIDHEAALEFWERYRRGERNVFTRQLYTLRGQETYDDIRRRYRRDAEFKRTVDHYVDQFERLLAEVAGDDRDQRVARSYLASDTGKVYTMLAHAAGRFDE